MSLAKFLARYAKRGPFEEKLVDNVNLTMRGQVLDQLGGVMLKKGGATDDLVNLLLKNNEAVARSNKQSFGQSLSDPTFEKEITKKFVELANVNPILKTGYLNMKPHAFDELLYSGKIDRLLERNTKGLNPSFTNTDRNKLWLSESNWQKNPNVFELDDMPNWLRNQEKFRKLFED